MLHTPQESFTFSEKSSLRAIMKSTGYRGRHSLSCSGFCIHVHTCIYYYTPRYAGIYIMWLTFCQKKKLPGSIYIKVGNSTQIESSLEVGNDWRNRMESWSWKVWDFGEVKKSFQSSFCWWLQININLLKATQLYAFSEWAICFINEIFCEFHACTKYFWLNVHHYPIPFPLLSL